jgi:hypothetical protein
MSLLAFIAMAHVVAVLCSIRIMYGRLAENPENGKMRTNTDQTKGLYFYRVCIVVMSSLNCTLFFNTGAPAY